MGAGLIRLTTSLAHLSGEWLASDWPVCPVSETAVPGAALTYARRYALFTLAGIAGEDDLDAPDLKIGRHPPACRGRTGQRDEPDTAASSAAPLPAANHCRRKSVRVPRVLLTPEDSSVVREKLIGELGAFTQVEPLTDWAAGFCQR